MKTVTAQEERIIETVAGLASWLETMRGPDGYGGPVVHWWQNCLQFTGAGLDWRYEGIIIGYVNLYDKTGNPLWLDRAKQAGDDLLRGQTENGSFHNSSFELNPYPGGTPHEAAAALGLLHLYEQCEDDDYLHAAERCLREFYIGVLWDEAGRVFHDGVGMQTFVPNKAATLCEALFKLADLTNDDTLITDFVVPTLDRIVNHQTHSGGIFQYSEKDRPVKWYFPYYISRCVPALLAGYDRTGEQRYCHAARSAVEFILKWREPDGSLPQVIYQGDRINRYPQWIAASGDVARALSHFDDCDTAPTVRWMLRGVRASGGIATARGFEMQASQRKPQELPEFRDVLPVVGWVDKAFRYLTDLLPKGCTLPQFTPEEITMNCRLRGIRMQYRENDSLIELGDRNRVVYRWHKGQPWAEICDLDLLWS
jgi:uncharacterized protein YyaL (SSP411 family)